MSVIVLGMEMPENCHVCGLCFGGLCFAIPPEVDVMCPDEGRPNWCPLRPLPEKHGDLIDISEKVNIEYYDDMNEEWSLMEGTVEIALFRCCEDFPKVIIKAEGD